jgi:hypothetical protein
LSRPPAISTTGRGKPSSAATTAPTLVPFESSKYSTPSTSPTWVMRWGSGSNASSVARTSSSVAPTRRAPSAAASAFSWLWRPTSPGSAAGYTSRSPPGKRRHRLSPSTQPAPSSWSSRCRVDSDSRRAAMPCPTRATRSSSMFSTAKSSAVCATNSRALAAA